MTMQVDPRVATCRELLLDLANMLDLPITNLRGGTPDDEWQMLADAVRTAVGKRIGKKDRLGRDRDEG